MASGDKGAQWEGEWQEKSGERIMGSGSGCDMYLCKNLKNN